MSSLAYLLSKKAVNRIKEIFRKPTELIIILVFIGLMCFTVFAGKTDVDVPQNLRNIKELYAIILALYSMIFILVAKGGFVNGASMFSMADVNLIFTSPKKQTGVLFYGLLSQLGRSLLLGFFILYQYTWLHTSYAVEFGSLVIILVGYGVTVFLSQMVSMLIYCFTSGSDKRNNILKAVFWLVIGAFIIALVLKSYFAKDGDLLSNVVQNANSLFMKFFPVAGFVQMGVIGAMSGNFVFLGVSLGCFAVFCLLFYAIINILNSDYYEDVLKATEVSFSAVTARKEGKAVETAPRNVKVGKTGFAKGEGASAISEKHKIENRRSKFFLTDLLGIIMIVVTVAVGYFSKNAIIALAANAYTMIFTVSAGRWEKDLHLPYVYLIPEPPFKKLLFMLKEQLPTLIFESALTFTALYFLLEMSVFEAVAFAFARISFGFMFIGVNLLLSRILGGNANKNIMIFVYFILAAVFSLPGIITAVLMYSLLSQNLAIAILLMSAVNALVSLLLIYLCRNILECAEYNNT